MAADGRFEPYKASWRFDNPTTRLPHGFPVSPDQKEVKAMLEKGNWHVVRRSDARSAEQERHQAGGRKYELTEDRHKQGMAGAACNPAPAALPAVGLCRRGSGFGPASVARFRVRRTGAAGDVQRWSREHSACKPLGREGVQLSIFGLGGYHLGTLDSVGDAIRIVHEAIDAGINFFDNAWEYSEGAGARNSWVTGFAGPCDKVFAGDESLHSRKEASSGPWRSWTSHRNGWARRTAWTSGANSRVSSTRMIRSFASPGAEWSKPWTRCQKAGQSPIRRLHRAVKPRPFTWRGWRTAIRWTPSGCYAQPF